MSQPISTNGQPEQRQSTILEKIRSNKQLAIMVAIVILVAILWIPVFHPLLDILRYSDEGEYEGRPVYYSENDRITLALHKELEKCGYSDSDLSEFLETPFGPVDQEYAEIDFNTGKIISKTRKLHTYEWQTIYYDNDGNVLSTSHTTELGSGDVVEIELSCHK